jgi:hypothetical protein
MRPTAKNSRQPNLCGCPARPAETWHAGYRISTIKRKRIEGPFGWIKTVGGPRKTWHRGRGLVEWFFALTASAYDLIRVPTISAAAG